ncbi:hypothetical protein B0H34DRAFT_474328 [Crassisporium funariophilum]|nr:hypothetical protein B0H34DRAFT_474328 [Crassisporium funariophilum]
MGKQFVEFAPTPILTCLLPCTDCPAKPLSLRPPKTRPLYDFLNLNTHACTHTFCYRQTNNTHVVESPLSSHRIACLVACLLQRELTYNSRFLACHPRHKTPRLVGRMHACNKTALPISSVDLYARFLRASPSHAFGLLLLGLLSCLYLYLSFSFLLLFFSFAPTSSHGSHLIRPQVLLSLRLRCFHLLFSSQNSSRLLSFPSDFLRAAFPSGSHFISFMNC